MRRSDCYAMDCLIRFVAFLVRASLVDWWDVCRRTLDLVGQSGGLWLAIQLIRWPNLPPSCSAAITIVMTRLINLLSWLLRLLSYVQRSCHFGNLPLGIDVKSLIPANHGRHARRQGGMRSAATASCGTVWTCRPCCRHGLLLISWRIYSPLCSMVGPGPPASPFVASSSRKAGCISLLAAIAVPPPG